MKNKLIFLGVVALLVAAFFFFLPKGQEKGECLDGNCFNGTGTLVFKDGRRYTGNFANGSYNGHGVLLLTDGRKYDGAWENNLPNGFGTQTNPDGTIYTGT